MKLIDLLNEDVLVTGLKGKSKEDVINELIDLFKDDPRVNDLEAVRTAVLEREKIMSTGVGKNFAVPHGKTNAVSDILCAFGKTEHPVDYQALDGEPVHLIFLLVGKENAVSTHIKLLSRISRMMTKDEFREKLMHVATTAELLAAFRAEEANYIDF